MQKIIQFFKDQRVYFLYAFLLLLSFFLTKRQYSYHSSVVVNWTGNVLGFVSRATSGWREYFYLRELNEKLSEENTVLRNQLAFRRKETLKWSEGEAPGKLIGKPYDYLRAKIVKNSFRQKNNYIIIDKGERDGVKPDMGVMIQNGILGVVVQATPDYAVVRSILHSASHIPSKFKKNDFFGSVVWEGLDRQSLTLHDIPRQAQVSKGDTVIVDSRSTIYPSDLIVGIVSDYKMMQNNDFYEIDIRLIDDMAAVSYVYVVDKKDNMGLDSLLVKYDE